MRPEVRPSAQNVAGGTAQYLPEAGNPTMIKSGNIYCNQEFLLGTELLYIAGPLSLQAEYGWNFCNNAQLATTGTGSALRATGPIENYVFNGGYVQASWMLTGENRSYDKKPAPSTGTTSADRGRMRMPFSSAMRTATSCRPRRFGTRRSLLVCRSQLGFWYHRKQHLCQWRHHERHQPGVELVLEL